MKNKKSIKIRILRSTLILVTVILLGIFVAFNTLLHFYIDKSADEKLDSGEAAIINYDYSTPKQFNLGKDYRENHKYLSDDKEEDEFMVDKEMKHMIKSVEEQSKVQSMIVSKSGKLLYPTSDDYYIYDITQLENIIKKVGKIKDTSSQKIKTKEESYYYSIVKLEKTYNEEDCYMILYVDIEEQQELVKNINKLLFIIMCVAGILTIFTTLFLSEKISKPIKKISEFAKQIGDGDFTKSDMELEDKELDELLKVMNKSAEYLDKYDKDQKIFFQNISHELRTPLMSMMGYAEAIKYDVMEKEKACNIILEEGDKLKDMIEELLYISRMDSISQEARLSEYDLREILSSAVESKQATAINKNIKLICEFSKKPLICICDEKSLRRAFLNIIENALRYAKSKIIISCKEVDKKIIINIENDGEHIEEKDLPYIFDRFYKGHKGKSGIGLSIVKSIIEKHHGKIECQNTDIGVKFIIHLDL